MYFCLLEILKFTQEQCGFVGLVYQIRNLTVFRKHLLKNLISSEFQPHCFAVTRKLVKVSSATSRDEAIAFHASREQH